MSKANDLARKKLDEVLAGLMTEKKMQSNDKIIIGNNSRDPIMYVKRNENNDWHKNRNESLQRVCKTEEWQEAYNKGLEKREENGWLEKNRASNKKKQTPCITPLGIFSGVNEAGKYYNETKNRKCGATVVCRNLKRNAEGYRYITQEEYIMLTGKDPFNEL
tara:strand:- start:465 stop:950 length:486 start_codon:yes stop_codon:yes gene_type:complete